jgi:hypothetical protein
LAQADSLGCGIRINGIINKAMILIPATMPNLSGWHFGQCDTANPMAAAILQKEVTIPIFQPFQPTLPFYWSGVYRRYGIYSGNKYNWECLSLQSAVVLMQSE